MALILSSTPFRVSFFGGGSDRPQHYRKSVGRVLSTSIDKFLHVAINKKFDSQFRISYLKTENVCHIDDIQHQLARECLRFMAVDSPVEISSMADIPANGSGLGSSSTYTVGLLNALHSYLGDPTTKVDLATQACHIEIDVCGKQIGKQDQFASAFGGFNLIEFFKDESVKVHPVMCNASTLYTLNKHLLMCHTGISRDASDTLSASVSTDDSLGYLTTMSDMALRAYEDISNNKIEAFGQLLHDSWMLKRKAFNTASTPQIDTWYEQARSCGAVGGKILGAGSGGFFVFFADPKYHQDILMGTGLRHVPFNFEHLGSQIRLK
jgi:D-glycero-alpha-D-manno-heptose-7-phosphate kinase